MVYLAQDLLLHQLRYFMALDGDGELHRLSALQRRLLSMFDESYSKAQSRLIALLFRQPRTIFFRADRFLRSDELTVFS